MSKISINFVENSQSSKNFRGFVLNQPVSCCELILNSELSNSKQLAYDYDVLKYTAVDDAMPRDAAWILPDNYFAAGVT